MSKPTPLLMCTSCGASQDAGAQLCSKCGAPLTPYAHVDVVMGIQSRGFALHKATTKRTSLVVVIGIWLWIAPLFTIACMYVLMMLGGLVQDYGRLKGAEMGFILVSLIAAVGAICVTGTILYRTTKNYLAIPSRRDMSGWPDEGMSAEEQSDPQECLSCGKSFPSDLSACPACGWSFNDDLSQTLDNL